MSTASRAGRHHGSQRGWQTLRRTGDECPVTAALARLAAIIDDGISDIRIRAGYEFDARVSLAGAGRRLDLRSDHDILPAHFQSFLSRAR